MRWVALAASSVWGLFLAFLLLGAALDGSIDVVVYAACALAVWLCAFVLACRREPSGTRLALIAIPLSILGPLAVLPVAFVRRRKARRSRPPETPKPPLAPAPRPPPASPAATAVVGLVILVYVAFAGFGVFTVTDGRGSDPVGEEKTLDTAVADAARVPARLT